MTIKIKQLGIPGQRFPKVRCRTINRQKLLAILVRKRPLTIDRSGYDGRRQGGEIMMLDWQVCNRARLTRDARFDGKFFIAVLTSRVYCRSICPARTAKEKNVRYYASAAAAEEAGFRPCMRCRPECSPGTPAWLGTPTTVSRALRLIGETGLEEGGVESLAERLGVGARHLRRLFVQHLGASPIAVAQTRRLQFAKKLIDETKLPMGEVAMVAGFGCVRRFNATIRKIYHRTPTQIRRFARQPASMPENHHLFRLRFRPPYHWQGMLAFLEARAIPGVEQVQDGVYRRSISIGTHSGYFEVSFDDANNSLVARIQFANPHSLFFIIERIRAIFDLNCDWQAIASSLRTDPDLAPRIQQQPGLRVPGCWSGFELAIRAILGQQITVKGASMLAGRIVSRFGRVFPATDGISHLFPAPEALAEADIASIGMPRARAETIRAFSRAVSQGHIRFEGIVDTAQFLENLCSIPGIGLWTAKYIAMRALGEPDAFPSSDLGLLHALYLGSARDLERRSEEWRPWRAYAAMYLWSVPGPSAKKSEPSTKRRDVVGSDRKEVPITL